MPPVSNMRHSTVLLRGIQRSNCMDVMFLCRGNVRVFAQKLVLLSVSPFFKHLLSYVSCCPHNIFCISLPDINPSALQLVLDFLYEGVMKVRASELQDFSDVMYVLGIEVPPSATAVKMETVELPEVQLPRPREPPPRVGRNLDLREPVDPLNVPDFYHNPTLLPRLAQPVSVASSTLSPMSVASSNVMEYKLGIGPSVDPRPPPSRSTSEHNTTRPSKTPARKTENKTTKKTNSKQLPEEMEKALENEFLKNPAPSTKFKKNLAKKLKINERTIKNWFISRRRKARTKMQPVVGAIPVGAAVPRMTVKEETQSFNNLG